MLDIYSCNKNVFKRRRIQMFDVRKLFTLYTIIDKEILIFFTILTSIYSCLWVSKFILHLSNEVKAFALMYVDINNFMTRTSVFTFSIRGRMRRLSWKRTCKTILMHLFLPYNQNILKEINKKRAFAHKCIDWRSL